MHNHPTAHASRANQTRWAMLSPVAMAMLNVPALNQQVRAGPEIAHAEWMTVEALA